MKIILANINHLDLCMAALDECILADKYFDNPEQVADFITDGISKNEVHAAFDSDNNFKGFMRIDKNGCFSKFPLLRLIAVPPVCRGKGNGKKMLEYYEHLGFESSDKVFLLVSDFNPRAKKLYESVGYIKVGSIPDLYKQGVTEFLMMKVKLAN